MTRSRVGVAIVASMLAVAMAAAQSYKQGPSGGPGGTMFVDDVPSGSSWVAKIRVWSGSRVDGVQLVYTSSDGGDKPAERHGGTGGGLQEFELRGEEYLVGVSGIYGQGVDRIQFHTSEGRSSPVYGGGGGNTPFTYEAPPGTEIVGLYGRAGKFIDAIGVVLRER